jgi:hypothetical protein
MWVAGFVFEKVIGWNKELKRRGFLMKIELEKKF